MTSSDALFSIAVPASSDGSVTLTLLAETESAAAVPEPATAGSACCRCARALLPG